MGGSLPCRLVVEDGHGKPRENAATEADLTSVLAALSPEQLERVIGPYLAPLRIESEERRRKIYRLEQEKRWRPR